MSTDLAQIDAAARAAISAHPGPIDRVVVVPECASTQDLARALAHGRPGLLVIAGRQSAGRGRLGRAWTDHQGLGLAATAALHAPAQLDALGPLSLTAGLIALRTVRALLPAAADTIGLRWPNDVVQRHAPHRKISGVLIELDGPLAIVGIGINIHQSQADWPAELRATAVSVDALGAAATRAAAAAALIDAFRTVLALAPGEALAAWTAADTLLNSRQSFEHAGIRYTGTVTAIDPLNAITLRDDTRGPVTLPALTTSLVKP